MLRQLLQRLEATYDTGLDGEVGERDRERVLALLMFEVARADRTIDDAERATIRATIERGSSLSSGEIDEITAAALEDSDAATSLHAYLRFVNHFLEKDEKVDFVEALWRVAYADGELDEHEEYTVRKISDLLFVSHHDFIRTKLAVAEG